MFGYKLNMRLKKRFVWLSGKLLGNISGETKYLGVHSQQNFRVGKYNENNGISPYAIENSKLIYSLYTNLMFTKFVMY